MSLNERSGEAAKGREEIKAPQLEINEWWQRKQLDERQIGRVS